MWNVKMEKMYALEALSNKTTRPREQHFGCAHGRFVFLRGNFMPENMRVIYADNHANMSNIFLGYTISLVMGRFLYTR
jgi:hypothetical protein